MHKDIFELQRGMIVIIENDKSRVIGRVVWCYQHEISIKSYENNIGHYSVWSLNTSRFYTPEEDEEALFILSELGRC